MRRLTVAPRYRLEGFYEDIRLHPENRQTIQQV